LAKSTYTEAFVNYSSRSVNSVEAEATRKEELVFENADFIFD
jgi:hypothetical protein